MKRKVELSRLPNIFLKSDLKWVIIGFWILWFVVYLVVYFALAFPMAFVVILNSGNSVGILVFSLLFQIIIQFVLLIFSPFTLGTSLESYRKSITQGFYHVIDIDPFVDIVARWIQGFKLHILIFFYNLPFLILSTTCSIASNISQRDPYDLPIWYWPSFCIFYIIFFLWMLTILFLVTPSIYYIFDNYKFKECFNPILLFNTIKRNFSNLVHVGLQEIIIWLMYIGVGFVAIILSVVCIGIPLLIGLYFAMIVFSIYILPRYFALAFEKDEIDEAEIVN